MFDFIASTLQGMHTEEHGALDQERYKHEMPLVELASADTVLIDVEGANYTLSRTEFDATIAKLRNARIFPNSYDCHFPNHKYADPQITPNLFDVSVPATKNHECELEALQSKKPVPGREITYHADSRSFEFAGITVAVNDQIHQHIEQGLKIHVWQNTEGKLCWLPSLMADALRNYLSSELEFKRRKQKTHELIEQCKALQPEPTQGLLNSLNFQVVGTYKVNMRMLHERGWGTGHKRNTVIHIGRVDGEFADHYALEQAADRSEPLCGIPAKFSYACADDALNRSATEWENTGVTCPRCIAAAKRILKQQVSEVTQVAS